MTDAPERIWLPEAHAEDAANLPDAYGEMIEYISADLARAAMPDTTALTARIAELEAVERKSRGYRVGHIAGFHAGIRKAAEVCKPSDFNDSDEMRVWEYVKHRILALIEGDSHE